MVASRFAGLAYALGLSLLVGRSTIALGQDKPQVSVEDFGKLSFSCARGKNTGAAVQDPPTPALSFYKWKDELHDYSSAPASLPGSFYSDLRTALVGIPSVSTTLPSWENEPAMPGYYTFKLHYKPQHGKAVDVSGVLFASSWKHLTVPPDSSYDSVRALLELLVSQQEAQSANSEERSESTYGVAKIQDGKLLMLNDSYKVEKDRKGKPVEFTLGDSPDDSLTRLLKTLNGHTLEVRTVLDDQTHTAQVLSVFASSKDWKAPVTAKDGSRIEVVSDAYQGGAGLEVTGIDSNGNATVWTPTGPGTLSSELLSITVDPKETGVFGYAFPKLGHLPLPTLVQQMTRTPGVISALDGVGGSSPAPGQAPAVVPKSPETTMVPEPKKPLPTLEPKKPLPTPGGE